MRMNIDMAEDEDYINSLSIMKNMAAEGEDSAIMIIKRLIATIVTDYRKSYMGTMVLSDIVNDNENLINVTIDLLVPYLKDEEAHMRYAAVRALGILAYTKEVSERICLELIALLKDEDDFVGEEIEFLIEYIIIYNNKIVPSILSKLMESTKDDKIYYKVIKLACEILINANLDNLIKYEYANKMINLMMKRSDNWKVYALMTRLLRLIEEEN